MYLCQIYLYTNNINKKCYVGQTQTHTINHGKYRPFGYMRRWAAHVSEAVMDSKENQCHALNNAIRKYGADNFTVTLLYTCVPSFANYFERMYIAEYSGLAPKGYNLTIGGKTLITEEQKEKISTTMIKLWAEPGTCKKYSDSHVGPNDQRKVDKYSKLTIYDIEIRKTYFSAHKRDGIRCILRTLEGSFRMEFCGKHVEYIDALNRARKVCEKLSTNIEIVE